MKQKIRKISSIFILTLAWQHIHCTEAWNEKSHFGAVGRHRGTGVAIGTKGYIGLGHYNGAGPNIVFSDWWEFDPGTNTWTQKANYPIPSYAAASFVIGNKAYVGTGVSAGNTFYSFDPFTNVWSPIQSVPSGGTDQIGFSVNDKGYYLFGSQLFEYDPLLDNWLTKNPAPFSPSSWSSSFTIEDKAYIKTGLSLYEYKPSLDQWIIRASFPGLATGGSAAFSVRDKGYIVCGYIGWLSELSDEVWEFDPATNLWTQLDDFPGTARRFTCGFAIGNKGYLGIGTNGTNMRDFWEFDELLTTEEELNFNVTIYPNPTSGNLSVKTSSLVKLNIYDVSGNLLVSLGETDNYLIDMSSFENGVYVLTLNDGKNITTRKILVQH